MAAELRVDSPKPVGGKTGHHFDLVTTSGELSHHTREARLCCPCFRQEELRQYEESHFESNTATAAR